MGLNQPWLSNCTVLALIMEAKLDQKNRTVFYSGIKRILCLTLWIRKRLWKMLTYPSPGPKFPLTSYVRQNVGGRGGGRSALTSYLLRRAGLGEARVQCSWALSRMLYWWLYLRDVDQVKINYWNGNENLSGAADNFSISWKQMRFNGLSLCVNWNVNPRKCLPCILHLTSQGFPV